MLIYLNSDDYLIFNFFNKKMIRKQKSDAIFSDFCHTPRHQLFTNFHSSYRYPVKKKN
jgi:hypothetical protein